MTKHVWKLNDYGHRWSAEQISDEMNILARDGWGSTTLCLSRTVMRCLECPARYLG